MNQQVGHVLRIFNKRPVAAVIKQMKLGPAYRFTDQLEEIYAEFIGSSRVIDPRDDQPWRLQTPPSGLADKMDLLDSRSLYETVKVFNDALRE